MTKYRSVNIQLKGLSIVVLAKDGEVDLAALMKIQEWLQKNNGKQLTN